MLKQIVYMSSTNVPIGVGQLASFASRFASLNELNAITGTLYFDGRHFLQVLEGGEQVLDDLYTRIVRDPRHKEVVLLLDEPVHLRRFGAFGMHCQDLRIDGAQSNIVHMPSNRIATVLQAFANGLWRKRGDGNMRFSGEFQTTPAKQLSNSTFGNSSGIAAADAGYTFAFQPIIDLNTMTVSSYEALLRGSNGEPPAAVLEKWGAQLHRFDLESKLLALSLASRLESAEHIALNLLPQSLLGAPNAVAQLVGYIRDCGFKTSQIVVEVTEEELIGDVKAFRVVIGQLRAQGIRVAIDDFGAGYAGLSLLADFQPNKVKIDRVLVQGIESHGPRQAIVLAIADCCNRLGIRVVAEGVETMAELQWLFSAGVGRIQGFLLAKPLINGLPSINWPQFVARS